MHSRKMLVSTVIAVTMAVIFANYSSAQAAPQKLAKSASISASEQAPQGLAPAASRDALREIPPDPSLTLNDVGSQPGVPDSLKVPSSGFGTQTVFGPDDRIRVTPTTTGINPAIVQIGFTVPGLPNPVNCTGFMISEDVVATAGHCLYNHGPSGAKGWIDAYRYTVIPALDGNVLPYGFCGVQWTASTVGWVDDKDSEYDYGVLKLDCNVGQATGTLSFEVTQGDIAGAGSLLRGYPGTGGYDGTTMWRTAEPIQMSSDYQLHYKHDTNGGQSGGPVIGDCDATNSGLCVIGIHTNSGSTTNYGVRVVGGLVDNYVQWVAAD